MVYLQLLSLSYYFYGLWGWCNLAKLSRREAIKVFIFVVLVMWGFGVPFGLYMDSRTQKPTCDGIETVLEGAIISTRPLPETRFSTEYLGSAKYITNMTSYVDYSSLYLYIERNGSELFVSSEPNIRNGSDWFIHKTNQYGIVEVCVIP